MRPLRFALPLLATGSFSDGFCLTTQVSRPSLTQRAMSTQDEATPFSAAVAITLDGADIAMAAAETEARGNGWDVTICICDAGGVPIQVKRNSFPASYDIAVGKARSATFFRKETAGLEAAVNVVEGISRAAMLSAPFLLMRGGVPIFLDGACCGAVGVSGVTAEQDEQVARAAVNALSLAYDSSKVRNDL